MLAPVLGRNHRVRDEFLGEFDSVVGKPFGTQVQADGTTAFGNSAELRLVVLGLAILGNARLVVHAKLNPVDSWTDGQQARESGRIIFRSDLRCKPLHHRIPVVLSVLRPDAESEVQAALTSPLGDANQHIQMPGALLCGKTNGTDLGKFGNFQQERVRWRQVGDLVAEGKAQIVITAARQPLQVLVPKLLVVEPSRFEPAVAEKQLHAAPSQVRRLDRRNNCRANVNFRRSQLDGARRFEQGVHQAAFVPAADEKSASGKALETQGLGHVGTAYTSASKGILHDRRLTS